MLVQQFEYETRKFIEEGTTEETLFLGLASEVGEVMQSRVKETRKGMECTAEILDELGDILWYVTTIAQARGYSVADLMTDVVQKLETRHKKRNYDEHGFYTEPPVPFTLGN